MNPRRLFVASCMALITSAFSFQIRGNIADPLGADFLLTKSEVGAVMGAAFLGMALAMLLVAPLCDYLGMKRVLFLAWTCHLVGILGTIFAPKHPNVSQLMSYWMLWLATLLVGAGNGLVEIAINPLAATLYPTQKTHYLNVLHAWWPGGLIISGLMAIYLIDPLMGLKADDVSRETASLGWKVKMALLLVPLAIYGIMIVGQRFPDTERVQANVSTGEMFLEALRPMFLLWAFCMLLTASSELGPNQWQESVLTRTARVEGTLVFVYTSGLMFVMRFFAGPLAHRLSPVGMLMAASVLTAIGLYWLSFVNTPIMAFVAATVFGIGIAYFWPTMLGVTAERFPKGGALLLGLMGCFGNLAISQALPLMGGIYDSYTVANIPPALRGKAFVQADGQPMVDLSGKPLVQTVKDASGATVTEPLTLVKTEEPGWLPNVISSHIYPAGSKKLDPDAQKVLDNARALVKKDQEGKLKSTPENRQELQRANELLQSFNLNEIDQAEAVGAAYAYRWVAVLPCILVFIFGSIALADRLRGGYKAVHIHEVAEPKKLMA
jgi:MFS family permease